MAAFTNAMINGTRIKVCGITTLVDAEAADDGGADFLGFNLFEKSPRFVALDQFAAMQARLPPRRKVAVGVSPTVAELERWAGARFDAFQIHFPHDTPIETIRAWSQVVGPDRLWLAPKLPPGAEVRPEWLQAAKAILWDTFAADKFGGTGKTGDWAAFRAARDRHPDTTWILAGGLSPDNVARALRETGATFLDVNSGVEAAPGVKDPAKIASLVAAMRAARTAL